MSKIRILPDILSNKIAAGEVVERPASVVKELVENAIDAQSTKITVEIEQGGKSLIQVSDNGSGMSHDDALLSIERYATSKIYSDADLYAIGTLGFRGEALPSIAAVSKLTLVTKEADASAATEIYVEGGKILKVSETGAAQGTLVSVRQLFYNVPARRKFLKSQHTEMSHIADWISCMALAWPCIQFRLEHNHKIVNSWPPAQTPADRVMDVLGHDLLNLLYAIEFAQGGMSVSGWISDPSVTRATSQKIFVFVNGRHVRDRGVQYALFEGYKGRIMKGRFPVAVIFLTLPPDQVDVNVHPAKSEVRFACPQEVYEAVRSAVAQAWKTHPRRIWQPMKDASLHVEESVLEFSAFPKQDPGAGDPLFPPNSHAHFSPKPANAPALADMGTHSEAVLCQKQTLLSDFLGDASQSELRRKFSECVIIGQFRNTYILCEQDNALLIIDQHAAHERIVFEQFKRQQAISGKAACQTLVLPETIDLSFREAAVIEKMLPDLRRLGLDMEPFGGTTVVVKSVPALLADRPIAPLIVRIAEIVAEAGYGSGLTEALEQCLILMACHAAIRAHQSLTHHEIKHLLSQLDACENPDFCPHGRPTAVRWSLSDFEKTFKRIK